MPRRRVSSRQRTSRYMGVGSSNRKNQWQARILVHGKACRPACLRLPVPDPCKSLLHIRSGRHCWID